jgi:L-lysine 2,3-aminomutase
MINKEVIISETENIVNQTKNNLDNVKNIALNEAWKILQLTVASVVQILENLATDLSGKEKKQFAMDFISGFYDRVFVIIDIPFVPGVLEPIIHKYVKKILMVLVASCIDATVTIFRNTGVFLKKGS